MVCDLSIATRYLEIQNLFDLAYQVMSDWMKEMSIEDIQELLELATNLTKEETIEGNFRKIQWSFDLDWLNDMSRKDIQKIFDLNTNLTQEGKDEGYFGQILWTSNFE